MNKTDFNWILFAFSDSVKEPQFINGETYLVPTTYLQDHKKGFCILDKFLVENNTIEKYLFRYPSASYDLFKLVKKHPGKFVFEHNTKELPEVVHDGLFWVKKFKFKLSVSYFKLVLNALVKPFFKEYLWAKYIFKYSKSGIAVTQEIAFYEQKRQVGYKCEVLSNGVNVDSISFYERSFQEGDILNLIMLSNADASWHGVDLIVNSFLTSEEKRIRIYFIGNFNVNDIAKAKSNPNLIFTGYLSADAFTEYFKNAHVGLGSFAAYRKNLEEGCSLKLREYFASGLPVFYGYKDNDVSNSDLLKKYSIYKDQRIEEINWREIYSWARDLYKIEHLNKNVRDAAKEVIDFSVKAQELMQKIK